MWALSFLLMFFADRDAQILAKLVPELTDARPAQAAVTASDIAKFDRALGRFFEPFFKKTRLYTGRREQGESKESLRVALLAVSGGDLAVALDAQGQAVGLGWYPEGTEPKADPAWTKFLMQFEGRAAKRFQASLTVPATQLEEKMRLALEGVSEEAKRLKFLLRQKEIMQKKEELYLFASDRLESKEDLKATLDALRTESEALIALAKESGSVLEAKAVERFKKTAAESRAILGQALASYERGNRTSAKQILDEDLQDSCSKCHGWDGHSLRKPLQAAMRELRGELGIGDGYFRLGFDVLPLLAEKPKESQEMATALKAVLLLLSCVP